MKSFILLVTALSLWIAVTATPQGYVEGTDSLDGLLAERDETEEYNANGLLKESARQSDRTVKGKFS